MNANTAHPLRVSQFKSTKRMCGPVLTNVFVWIKKHIYVVCILSIPASTCYSSRRLFSALLCHKEQPWRCHSAELLFRDPLEYSSRFRNGQLRYSYSIILASVSENLDRQATRTVTVWNVSWTFRRATFDSPVRNVPRLPTTGYWGFQLSILIRTLPRYRRFKVKPLDLTMSRAIDVWKHQHHMHVCNVAYTYSRPWYGSSHSSSFCTT